MTETYVPLKARDVTIETGHRRVKRLRKKRAETMPLFEGTSVADQIMPIPDAEAIVAYYEYDNARYIERLNECREWLVVAAARYRDRVAKLVTLDKLAELDAHREQVLPARPAYGADYWHGLWRKLDEKVEAEEESWRSHSIAKQLRRLAALMLADDPYACGQKRAYEECAFKLRVAGPDGLRWVAQRQIRSDAEIEASIAALSSERKEQARLYQQGYSAGMQEALGLLDEHERGAEQ
jgi:hypothetical protein